MDEPVGVLAQTLEVVRAVTGIDFTRYRPALLDPADRALVWDAIEHAIDAQAEFDLAHRVVTVTGDLVGIRSRATPILDASGQIRAWFGVASRGPHPGTVR